MNIIIEARALAAKGGGIKTYTYELIRNLLIAHQDEKFQIVYPEVEKPLFSSVETKTIPMASELFVPYWLSGPVASYIRTQHPSVVHYTKAAIPLVKIAPTIVTIYDIIPILLPETQSISRRMYWSWALKHAATHADHIITISHQSKVDIMNHFGISEEKITVTPLAINSEHFYPREKKHQETPYILFVGTKDQRKNISSLVYAFARIAKDIPHKLLIVGRPAKKQDSSQVLAKQMGLENRIEFREDVSYEELPEIYSQADLFVWPSAYEGWGFPPQEAMACGTPVIVSNGAPLPEVVGDAGRIVPFSFGSIQDRMRDEAFIERLADQMRHVLADESLRKDMIAKGIEQAKKFSWQKVAEDTWNVYKRIAV